MGSNGVARYVKLALATVLSIAFVVVGFDIIKLLYMAGRIDAVMFVVGLYLGALSAVVKDFLTSGKEEVRYETPAGCKSSAEIRVNCE